MRNNCVNITATPPPSRTQVFYLDSPHATPPLRGKYKLKRTKREMPQTTTTSEEDEEEEQKMTLRTFHKLFLLRLKNDRQRRQKSERERERASRKPKKKKKRRKKLNLCPHPIEAKQPQQQCNTKWHAATTLSVRLPHPLQWRHLATTSKIAITVTGESVSLQD